MLPYIYIFGFPVPMYGLMAIIGFVVSLVVALKRAGVYGLTKQDMGFSSAYMVIGIIIGSKLMYFITNIPKLINNWDLFLERPWEVIMIVFSGFVFYGGLIGGALGVIIYAKQFKLQVMPFADAIAPVIPLFHAFGRIGCFFGGCCYGIEYHGIFAIDFPYNELTPELSEVTRFPVQFMESLLNIILFIFLLIYSKKKRKSGQTLGIYLLCYAVIRTVTEMFRGDLVRGVYAGISTSQIISIILLPLGLWLIFRKEKTAAALSGE
jgi:phosphatidylglycerol:prolipoprotein diacylglycerol transferase